LSLILFYLLRKNIKKTFILKFIIKLDQCIIKKIKFQKQ